ncbi:hypothetical protein VTH06DRAFT_4430 [Thermothelomyces fergusii]
MDRKKKDSANNSSGLSPSANSHLAFRALNGFAASLEAKRHPRTQGLAATLEQQQWDDDVGFERIRVPERLASSKQAKQALKPHRDQPSANLPRPFQSGHLAHPRLIAHQRQL